MEMKRDRRSESVERAQFAQAAPSRPGPSKDWELTPEAFSKLLAELSPDPEAAGEKYEELRGQLIKFFEWRGSFFPDQRADETLNRVARKIAEGERIEKTVTAFALGVARFVLLESLRDADRRRVEMDDLTEMAAPAGDPSAGGLPFGALEDDDQRLDCLKQCLKTVPAENRRIIIEYYADEKRAKIDTRKSLAATLGISLNALFSRAKRLRDKLEHCVTRCMKK
jgi:DNA-directed RNA polymerase specialized sigma24 family protein